MLNKLKEQFNELLKTEINTESIKIIESIGKEIDSVESKVITQQNEFNELKNDYIKVVKSSSFKVTAEPKDPEEVSLESIASEVIKRRKEK